MLQGKDDGQAVSSVHSALSQPPQGPQRGSEFHVNMWPRQSLASLDLPAQCSLLPGPPWECTSRLGQGGKGFHFHPPLSRESLTLEPDARASLEPGSTQEATRGVPGRCRPTPLATQGHPAGPPFIWPSCAGALELIHKNVPFSSDWLLVTSSEFGRSDFIAYPVIYVLD